ncbi:SDR family NAD(P)-dependent oxidoreductase [Streptomyces sp. NPDC001985]|uniref:SDR family NAD(P)-dependent oxidoreductase n=1 Tax=Streptomyces sp. NPDC001985 TaxID=3154406 RepID=UPI003316EA60
MALVSAPTEPPDPELLAELTGRARRVPGVSDAEVIVRLRRRGAVAGPGPAAPVPEVGRDPRPALAHGTGPAPADDWPATLPQALVRAARDHGERGTTYVRSDGTEHHQSYARLLTEATRVLGGLRAEGLTPGQSVLLQFQDNRNFVTAFWACVLGGFLPTPVGAAPTYREHNATTRRLHGAWQLLDHPLIVTDEALLPGVAGLAGLWGEAGVRTAALERLEQSPPAAEIHPAEPGDIALNLLTSGSTGVPKCVQHPHRTIAARTWATAVANGFGPDEVSLNWMPLDHVGGIVMYNVRDVFLGCAHVNALTSAFVGRPTRWLDWIERYGATNTWAPNFAFALVNDCADAIAEGGWDLSSMRNICNAGEAVVARTARSFLRLLAPHGLSGGSMVPCWGMSETSSGVTYARMDRDDDTTGVVSIDQRTLDGDLAFVTADAPHAVSFTEVGPPIAGVSLRIVDHGDRVLPESRVGRLQVSGTTVLNGYYGNPEANRESFTEDGWFDTGDLAFLKDGRLTLTGRAKDLIIVNGGNYPSHDIESVAGRVPGVKVSSVAACGISDPYHGTDRVAVFYVPLSSEPAEHTRVAREVGVALAREMGLRPDLVVPVPEEEFPKTESGKIQRGALRDALLAGRFDDRLGSVAATGAAAPDDPGPWTYTKVWQPVPAPVSASTGGGGPLLLFEDSGGELAAALGDRFPRTRVVTVRRGNAFARTGADTFTLRPSAREDCVRLIETLAGEGAAPEAVVHAWALPRWPEPPDADDSRDDLYRGAISVLWCLQSLVAAGAAGTRLLVVTSGAHRVREDDRVDWCKGAIAGVVRTAAEEECLRAVGQLDLSGDSVSDAAAAVARELGLPATETIVAERDGARVAPRLREVPEPDGLAATGTIRSRGVYLLVGGLGGIGFEVARYLLSAHQARLLVVGRRTLGGDDEATRRYTELGELGDVRYAVTDTIDAEGLSAAVAAAEAAWSRPLDGVFHLAGEPVAAQWDRLEEHTVPRESVDRFLDQAHPKVGGAWALRQLLLDRPGALLVLFSSVNGFFGGSSFVAYASANSALDAFGDSWAARGRPVRCLAWSMWEGTGMNTGAPTAAAARRRGFLTIAPERGIASLLAALAQDQPYVLIGGDAGQPHFQRALEHSQLEAGEMVVAIAPTDPEADPDTLVEAVRTALGPVGPYRVAVMARLPRDAQGRVDAGLLPAARQSFARRRFSAPEGERERGVAAAWSQVLAVPRVGRDDGFFELGGNSVRALQIMTRVNDLFGTDHSVSLLYENPTVRDLTSAFGERARG